VPYTPLWGSNWGSRDPDKWFMRTATVEDIAQEFMRILAEGWSPDPEEFLHRVPEALREQCRERLDELLGAQTPETPEAEDLEALAGGEEMIVFDLGGDSPIESVRAPSQDPVEVTGEVDAEPEMDEIDAVALEAALEPELDEAEMAAEPDSEDVETALEEAIESVLGEPAEEAVIEEPATEEPEIAEVVVEEPVAEEPETAEVVVEEPAIEEPETADEAVVEEPAIEEPETAEIVEEEPVVEEEPETAEVAVEEPVAEEEPETVAVEEPEPVAEPKPEGLVKLTKAEAAAMFAAMAKSK